MKSNSAMIELVVEGMLVTVMLMVINNFVHNTVSIGRMGSHARRLTETR